MKKDKEWAKKEVDRYLSYEGVDEARNALVFVKGVIDQLDEPEVLSQKWISENVEYAYFDMFDVLDGSASLSSATAVIKPKKLQNLLVPKQEKVKIPKFVAEYLDFAKSDTTLMRVLELANTRDEWEKWEKEYDWIEGNHELFARAWLDGYEVEKEQKYYVLDKEDATLLKKTERGGVAKAVGTNIYNVKSWKDEEKYQLTKQEIKDYDERYMMFSVRIEEFEK